MKWSPAHTSTAELCLNLVPKELFGNLDYNCSLCFQSLLIFSNPKSAFSPLVPSRPKSLSSQLVPPAPSCLCPRWFCPAPSRICHCCSLPASLSLLFCQRYPDLWNSASVGYSFSGSAQLLGSTLDFQVSSLTLV